MLASWLVWIRRTVTQLVGFTGDDAPHAVFSLFLSSGPRCSASWPVWIRRTFCSDTMVSWLLEKWPRSSSTPAVVCPLRVLLMMMQVLLSLRVWQDHDHGRYGMEVAALVVDLGSCMFMLSGGKRALVRGCGFVGTGCAFALRGMVLLRHVQAVWTYGFF